MRIALFTEVFLPKVDGITNRIANTVRCLRARGHEVLLFAPSGAVAGFEGARVVRVPGISFPRYPELEMGLPHPKIAWELARFRPEVVHAVGPACLGVWGVLTARALGLPIVASYHTDLPRYLPLYGLDALEPVVWPLLRRVHDLASLNLCPSEHTRAELELHGVRHVELWPGGIDAELFHPKRRSLTMRARLTDGAPDRPLALYAGRLSPEKNLEALAPLLRAMPDLQLALVGDGPARPELERVFADLPVTFTGYLRGEVLATAFASADVFVMPSTTETLGFVVLEAMGAGCPVVAARAGGIPDTVEDGENGVLYDPDCAQDLVDGVARVLDNPAWARVLAQRARKRAENRSWQDETRKLRWAYRRAIQRHRSDGLLRRVRYAFSPDPS